MIASLGADSLSTAVFVLAVGFVFDVARNAWAPDLQLSDGEISQALRKSIAEPEQALAFHRPKSRNALLLIWGGAFLYTLFWMVVPSDGHIAQAYLSAFSSVHDVVGMVLGAIPRLARDLTAHGYAARVPVVVHMHAVHFLTFVAAVLVFFSGASWHDAHAFVAEEKLRPMGRVRKFMYSIPLWILLGVLFYAFWSKGIKIDWNGRSRRIYNVHVSDFDFLYSFLIGMFIWGAFWISYSYAIVWSLGGAEFKKLPSQTDA